ncbi:E3 ubiquitin-protein ligase SMURF1 [Striga asiatica]|uniref:E3 ubiquitin-protein ligase SMURF1 n=1 Tax=Striga asiatica TaxID=4170 RepID=A0A5A7PUR3_STRAF|nr:E3 ubiquitin-protein ligase SMURF1 [Striga asiatica]
MYRVGGNDGGREEPARWKVGEELGGSAARGSRWLGPALIGSSRRRGADHWCVGDGARRVAGTRGRGIDGCRRWVLERVRLCRGTPRPMQIGLGRLGSRGCAVRGKSSTRVFSRARIGARGTRVDCRTRAGRDGKARCIASDVRQRLAARGCGRWLAAGRWAASGNFGWRRLTEK